MNLSNIKVTSYRETYYYGDNDRKIPYLYVTAMDDDYRYCFKVDIAFGGKNEELKQELIDRSPNIKISITERLTHESSREYMDMLSLSQKLKGTLKDFRIEVDGLSVHKEGRFFVVTSLEKFIAKFDTELKVEDFFFVRSKYSKPPTMPKENINLSDVKISINSHQVAA